MVLGLSACGLDPGFEMTAAEPDETAAAVGPVASANSGGLIVEPSDNGSGLLGAIQNTQRSVHVTMYLLTSKPIQAALIDQHAAGHEVEVVLNHNFSFTPNPNAAAYAALTAAGVPVHWASSSYTYTHEKCVIIDRSVAWIMTMNASASSPSSNREYLAIDTAAADVAEAESIFEADFAGTPITPTGSLLVSPVNALQGLTALISSATQTIELEAEELSDTNIVSALAAAADRSVAVKAVISSNTLSQHQLAAIATLKAHHVSLVTLNKPYMHAKALAVDSKRAYIGSINFSTTSLTRNRELGLVLTSPTEVTQVVTTARADFAAGKPL